MASSRSEPVSSNFPTITNPTVTSVQPPPPIVIPSLPITSSMSPISSSPMPISTPFTSIASLIFSHPVFSVNIKNFVPEILTHENYVIWKDLMIPVFKSKGVYGHIDGIDPCPPPTDPNFENWKQIDFQILSWIKATISSEVLRIIIQSGASLSAKAAWDVIQTSYQNQLWARKHYVKQQYRSMRKQSGQSMFSYLESVKKIADNMYDVGEHVTDKDIVMQALAGLDNEYSVAKRTIPQWVPFPSFLELRWLLLIEEDNVQHFSYGRFAFLPS
ncbi:hypothetical protein SLEP1_g28190 [Rubroshorea leprosula]|uniref:Retrotransposon Copia-like N-terminal domain-containing protein n=1 Tax=Rubroshorea leprosula TaxID=152421 RepID=A0AAV5JSU7_9ROSI|nr:hypothetical protein SLEP1_g28190 [Rubroshorea leprosula]